MPSQEPLFYDETIQRLFDTLRMTLLDQQGQVLNKDSQEFIMPRPGSMASSIHRVVCIAYKIPAHSRGNIPYHI